MNRTILGRLIHLIYARSFVVDGDGTGGGTGGTGDKGAEPPAVKPEDARTFLVELGHNPEALKTAKDDDVVKTYKTVNENVSKRTAATLKAEQEKATKAQTEALAANKTKWEKGEHKLEVPKEKTLLTQADADEIAATAREQGLSIDQAKQALQARDVAYQTALKRQVAMSEQQRGEWVKTLEADPELATMQKNSLRAIDKFMPQELRDKLKATGFGDYPPLVKFLSAVGAAMGEDSGAGGKGGGGGEKKDAASVLYGAGS